ncbi:HypC/HybG/HupF family hydrogenase formation chaperone [Candidatus Solincola tengchongensis]|uniref:HypC/HybG/HupF family hydrogenase formation chaperone n=1 Tax=Candidatus Solincola tengchongensis TaxID=2900693 RepID=UPI00257A6955|nr:HypC/HybG/HupF family hydrogenase formation chaperone [Candidatus Solincola tengchongensis]
MCLAIPAEVVELREDETALVEIGGVRKVVSLMLMDGVEAGDYVLVHAGFAIEKVDREEAEKTLAVLEQAAEYGPLYE